MSWLAAYKEYNERMTGGNKKVGKDNDKGRMRG
jgi:hypothetical protein